MLSEHFGQAYDAPDCGACDVCLGEVEGIADATVIAQKILSCVARVEQRFGVGHVADVLLGADTDLIRRCRHQGLSTYGLLKEHDKKAVQSWIYQLLDLGLVSRTEGDRPVLRLNEQSWAVLRGEATVRLIRPQQSQRRPARREVQSWEGADRGLFDRLRQWRREVAAQRQVAPFMILPDSVLQQLAILRPTGLETLRQVSGIGEQRLANFGADLIALVGEYCREHWLACDTAQPSSPDLEETGQVRRSAGSKEAAFPLFARGHSLEQVAQALGRARSTTVEYLRQYIAEECPARIDAWVDEPTYRRVAAAAATSEDGRLKPLFEQLGGEVPYDVLRLVLTHMQATENQ